MTAEQVRALREKTGHGMFDCKVALLRSGGDMLLAEGFLHVQGRAVHITGDRDEWEREQAERYAAERRSTAPVP